MFVQHNHFKYILYPYDTISRTIAGGTLWEPHMLNCMDKLILPEYNCLDIGANFGYHTLEMSRLAHRGTIFSFEPQIENNVLLSLNVKYNKCNNVKVFFNACGDTKKISRLPILNIINSDYIINMGDLSLNRANEVYQTVEVIDIDSLLLPDIHFVKIDVQGYELFCLQGMKKLIEKNNPIIVIEFEDHEMGRFSLSSKDIYDFLLGCGYHLFLLDADYSCDHLCIHSSKIDEFRKKYNEYISENDKQENKICKSINGLIKEKIVF